MACRSSPGWRARSLAPSGAQAQPTRIIEIVRPRSSEFVPRTSSGVDRDDLCAGLDRPDEFVLGNRRHQDQRSAPATYPLARREDVGPDRRPFDNWSLISVCRSGSFVRKRATTQALATMWVGPGPRRSPDRGSSVEARAKRLDSLAGSGTAVPVDLSVIRLG
jgi:hypothetical protein